MNDTPFTPLASATLAEFATTFFGYGDLSADWWFVGMEEGGGHSADEISSRLAAWQELGGGATVDIVEFGRRAGIDEPLQWFEGARPPLQSTWRQLIRMVLGADGCDTSAEAVRSFQVEQWGRIGGESCLVELLPLPSPSVDTWHYGEWSELEWLQSRQAYRKHLMEPRIEALRDLIREYRPKCVVFYSYSGPYVDAWSAIAGCDFGEVAETVVTERGERALKTRIVERKGTVFANVLHPTAWGVPSAYFVECGRLCT